MTSANTYDSDSYPFDCYLGVFGRVERRLWFRLRRARSHESAYEWHLSGSARVLGYTVYRGFLNQVYGILQLKYGYSVYHFL